MEPCESIQALRKQFRLVNSGCAGDTIFGAKALMFLCELAVAKNAKKARKPSKWNLAFAAGIKAGKSPAQISKEYKARG